jgi:glycosyltransferase involved in cell wall biosynthesis
MEIKNKELLKNTSYYNKDIEILHISDNIVNIIEKEEDIKEFNPYKGVDYETMIKIYNKADIFINTHYESMGLTNLECAMGGALIVTFNDYLKDEFLKKIHHHKIIDDNVDWLTIFNKMDINKSRNIALKYNYKNTIDKLIKYL